tara:strand:- start:152 stop:424 length:273 start_codon:yes stop_codon:yes gene_type:complete
MKKQAIALVASGLLLASGAVLAQDPPQTPTNPPAAAGTGTGTGTGVGGGIGGVSTTTLVVGTAIVGGAVAAASDSGDGSTGTTGTTGTTP